MGAHFISQEIELNTFEEFESFLTRIFEDHKKLCKRVSVKRNYPLLFRGHMNSKWSLSTTLERAGFLDLSFREYVLKVEETRSQIETIINKRWDYQFKELDLHNAKDAVDLLPTPKLIHLYELFVYLRHHAFPSPLLDWSTSPYVAAYFAFDFMGKEAPDSNKVAIYCYAETIDGTKSGEEGRGMIWGIGPNLVAHKRHFLQQCRYTICLKKNGNQFVFGNHGMGVHPYGQNQDIIIKMVLPYSIKNEVLTKLKLMNIGPYQLFDGEDNFIRGLAYEKFQLV